MCTTHLCALATLSVTGMFSSGGLHACGELSGVDLEQDIDKKVPHKTMLKQLSSITPDNRPSPCTDAATSRRKISKTSSASKARENLQRLEPRMGRIGYVGAGWWDCIARLLRATGYNTRLTLRQTTNLLEQDAIPSATDPRILGADGSFVLSPCSTFCDLGFVP